MGAFVDELRAHLLAKNKFETNHDQGRLTQRIAALETQLKHGTRQIHGCDWWVFEQAHGTNNINRS